MSCRREVKDRQYERVANPKTEGTAAVGCSEWVKCHGAWLNSRYNTCPSAYPVMRRGGLVLLHTVSNTGTSAFVLVPSKPSNSILCSLMYASSFVERIPAATNASIRLESGPLGGGS